MPRLARIDIYPIKSLDGQSVDSAQVLANGALADDRRYALVDRQGDFVNGKRSAAFHRLRSHVDFARQRLTLCVEGSAEAREFDLDGQRADLSAWLSDFFGQAVELVENTDGGFPDDTESPGPTLISVATLDEVGRWFGGLPLDETRARFRANLEIGGVEPFWEDRLVAEADRVVRFRIGEAELLGTNPCQRCAVPTRHPTTGEVWPGFAKKFAAQRADTLPKWSPASRYDHFYRLAVNTRRRGARPCLLRVGDEVHVGETV